MSDLIIEIALDRTQVQSVEYIQPVIQTYNTAFTGIFQQEGNSFRTSQRAQFDVRLVWEQHPESWFMSSVFTPVPWTGSYQQEQNSFLTAQPCPKLDVLKYRWEEEPIEPLTATFQDIGQKFWVAPNAQQQSFRTSTFIPSLDVLKYRWEQRPEDWFQAAVFNPNLWTGTYQQERNSFLVPKPIPQLDVLKYRWEEPIEPLTATLGQIPTLWAATDAPTKSFRTSSQLVLDPRGYDWAQHPELYVIALNLLFDVLTQGAGIWQQQGGSFLLPSGAQLSLLLAEWGQRIEPLTGTFDQIPTLWAGVDALSKSYQLPSGKTIDLRGYDWAQHPELYTVPLLPSFDPLTQGAGIWMQQLLSFLLTPGARLSPLLSEWVQRIEPLQGTFADVQKFWVAPDAETKSFRVAEGRRLDLRGYPWFEQIEPLQGTFAVIAQVWPAIESLLRSFRTGERPRLDPQWLEWVQRIEPLTGTFAQLPQLWAAVDALTKSFRLPEGRRLDLRSYEWMERIEGLTGTFGQIPLLWTPTTQLTTSFRLSERPRLDLRGYDWTQHPELYGVAVNLLFSVITQGAGIWSQQGGSFLAPSNAKLLLQLYEWVQRDEVWKPAFDQIPPFTPAWMELLQSFVTAKALGRDPIFDVIQEIGWWTPILTPAVQGIYIPTFRIRRR